MSIYICLYVHLYEYLGMIYTSDNKSVYIHTFIQVIIFICVLNELSKIKI